MHKQKAVIFDFDGTLADSLEVVIDIFRQLTGWQGSSSPEELYRLRRLSLSKLPKEFHVPMYRIPWLLARGRKLMSPRLKDVALFEGMVDALRTLRQNGYKLLVISSNSTMNVEQFLRSHELDTYFDAVYGGSGLFNKATALRRVIRREGVDRQLSVYVGDEQRDIEAAHKADLRCIAVAWGHQDKEWLASNHPFALAEKPQDILKVLTVSGRE